MSIQKALDSANKMFDSDDELKVKQLIEDAKKILNRIESDAKKIQMISKKYQNIIG